MSLNRRRIVEISLAAAPVRSRVDGKRQDRGNPACSGGSRQGRSNAEAGITFVELLVVIVIAAILVSLALPSFGSLIARKRLEGVASEFTTDLQFARSESVLRQQAIRVSSGSVGDCYVVHTFPGGSASCSCSATAPSCSSGAEAIKFVPLAAGTTLSAGQTVEFEPVRGMSTAASTTAFRFGSTGGNWELRSELTTLGRVRTCSPNGLLAGYSSC